MYIIQEAKASQGDLHSNHSQTSDDTLLYQLDSHILTLSTTRATEDWKVKQSNSHRGAFDLPPPYAIKYFYAAFNSIKNEYGTRAEAEQKIIQIDNELVASGNSNSRSVEEGLDKDILMKKAKYLLQRGILLKYLERYQDAETAFQIVTELLLSNMDERVESERVENVLMVCEALLEYSMLLYLRCDLVLANKTLLQCRDKIIILIDKSNTKIDKSTPGSTIFQGGNINMMLMIVGRVYIMLACIAYDSNKMEVCLEIFDSALMLLSAKHGSGDEGRNDSNVVLADVYSHRGRVFISNEQYDEAVNVSRCLTMYLRS